MITTKKIFYFEDDETKPIMAGGMTMYKIENKAIYLLLVEKLGELEDLGGKTDTKDNTIYDTVSREVFEESNGVFDKNDIKNRLPKAKYTYNQNSKYIIYIVQANDKEAKLTSDKFGDIESHNNKQRQIKWVSLKAFMNKIILKFKINHRLKNKYFFDNLKKIESDMYDWMIFN